MIVAVAEAAKHLSLWQDYVQTQFDPAHLLSELGFTLFFDGVVGALAWPLVKRAVRLHDRKAHRGQFEPSESIMLRKAHQDGLI